jgi:hypothetical protein
MDRWRGFSQPNRQPIRWADSNIQSHKKDLPPQQFPIQLTWDTSLGHRGPSFTTNILSHFQMEPRHEVDQEIPSDSSQ